MDLRHASGADVRRQARSGVWTNQTSGLALGYVQANLVVVPPAAVALGRRRAPELRGLLFLSVPIVVLGDLILLLGAVTGRLRRWDLADDAACGGDDVLCDQWGMLPLALVVLGIGALGVAAAGLGALRRRALR